MTEAPKPSYTWLAPMFIAVLVVSGVAIGAYQFVFLPNSLIEEVVDDRILNPPSNITIFQNKNSWRPDSTQAFLPSRVTAVLAVNNTIVWENIDDTLEGVIHTATDDNSRFDSGNMVFGDSFSYTYTKPGVYGFFCRPHSGWMRGTVDVLANPSVGEV